MIFEKLYQLLAADRGALTPRVFNVPQNGTPATSASITNEWQNATKQIFLPGALAWNFTPGAGQNYVSSVCAIIDKDGNVISNVMGESNALGAAVVKRLDRQYPGCVYVPPLFKLRTVGVFSAGANANAVDFFIHGIFIPVGTILW